MTYHLCQAQFDDSVPLHLGKMGIDGVEFRRVKPEKKSYFDPQRFYK